MARGAIVAESSIPIDLLNPGQVFACIGLLEATEVLLGNATGGFSWNRGYEATFRVNTSSTESPVEHVMAFLDEAEVVPMAPAGSPNLDKWKDAWSNRPEVVAAGEPFPFPDPDSPATLPVVLCAPDGRKIPVDYWGDTATRRDNVKFWGGSGGYPGAALLRDALEIVRGKMRQHANNPFALSGAQTSSFRLDWRRDYVPIQIGFSINKHTHIQTTGFPLVEVLAAIGVSHARPRRASKLEYRYGVIGGGESILLEPMFHRAALGAAKSPAPGSPFRQFVMHLDWPGQEGQERCITQVTEEETTQ